jgi:hypothetical protein
MRFDQRNQTIRTNDGDRKSRETCAGTNIRNSQTRDGRKVRRKEQRFAIMALDRFPEVLDPGQIQNLVPTDEKFVMRLKESGLRIRYRSACCEEITKHGKGSDNNPKWRWLQA